MEQKIIAGFSNVIGCERCSETDVQRDAFFNLPQPGFVGKNYAAHKVIFIGQNPGTSPEHFAAEDKLYADLLLKLRQKQDSAAYSELYAFLVDFMRKWQVNKNYFPLDECGLGLEDIAYFNLVRCRTRANAVPGRNVTSACMRHFVNWIEMLSPAVVVCIGKNPYDGISLELEQRGIPCCFINRARDLNNSERQINRNNAGNLVKSVLSGKPVVRTAQPAPVKVPETPALKSVKKPEIPKVKINLSGDRQSMFRQILKALGFEGDIAVCKVLKHRLPVPSMYFNSNANHEIYFTAWEKDLSRFHPGLWARVEGSMKVKGKNLQPGKINVAPKFGKEEEAFRKLLGC